MRAGKFGWMLVTLAVAGCDAADDFGPCKVDADCEAGAACAESFCVADPLPRIVLVADRTGARVGDMVRIDASASTLAGPQAALDFTVEPADAARIVRSEENSRIVEVQPFVPHTAIVITASSASAHGRLASSSLRIEPLNSLPRVALRAAADGFEPGALVEIVADASDADGDGISLAWTLVAGPGELESTAGDRAWLRTASGHLGRYTVRVDAADGRPGGASYAVLTLEPTESAPSIDPGAWVEVDHFCDGDPLECRAVARLSPVVTSISPVSASWQLLDGGDVTATFEPADRADTTVTLRCAPACPIAGDYRLELTVSDPQRREAKAIVEVRVGNRPPVVRAHDGADLPREFLQLGADGAARYHVFRENGVFFAWHDPDGDPFDPASVEWTSSHEYLAFDDPTALDTGFSVVGTAPELLALQVLVVAADWNGAGAADSRSLPIRNRPPSVRFDDDLTEGHFYVGDPEAPYRKRIPTAEARDDDGDPLHVRYSLVQPARPGLRLFDAGQEALLAGQASVVGFDHEVMVTVRDDWGAEVKATALVRLTNRAPVVRLDPGHEVFTVGAPGSSPAECCDPAGGGCTYGSYAMSHASFFPTHAAPLQVKPRFVVVDPDGDPIDLRLVNAHAFRAKLTIDVAQGVRELASEVLCSVRGEGACTASLQMSGRLATPAGTRCDFDTSILKNSFAFIHAIGVDSLGDEGDAAVVRLEAR
ncbi:MAG TPA: hypothetical protein VGD74_04910 [Vulgatibacter sp.]